MFFNFLKPSSKADSTRQNEPDAELAIDKDDTPVKANSADKKIALKKSAAEKESSVAEKEEADSRKDRLKGQSNSKVECRNPYCTDSALSAYDGKVDDDGDAIVSHMYCLNCGFNFPYFDKFEKEEKKTKGGPDLSVGFMFLVAMLFTVIIIRGEEEGRFFSPESPTSNGQEESVQLPRTDSFSQDEYRVLNDAEPFRVNNN